jgi:hypothetical protein
MDLWILTEEKPKLAVLEKIVEILNNDFQLKIYKTTEANSIIPTIKNSIFKFYYKVTGYESMKFENIYVKIVSGNSSFLDYLVFLSIEVPKENDFSNLLFALEETKTSDKDSRNTSVYQRATKFVFASIIIRKPMYMLYIEQGDLKINSATNNFGIKLMLTAGVKIINKNLDYGLKPFSSVEEIINEKNRMRKPPKSNTPVNIILEDNEIRISARLDKPGNIGKASHDPNIGLVSIISFSLRKLGWNGDIIITKHNLDSKYLEIAENKLTIISSFLDIKFQNIELKKISNYKIENYYKYDTNSEKNATILLHILLENSGWKLIYNNHAGGERGNFYSKNDILHIPKRNSKKENINIPDIIMGKEKLIGIFEGKNKKNILKGIKQIEGYDYIEENYLKVFFENHKIFRALVVYDKTNSTKIDELISFILYSNGEIIYSKDKFNNLL